MFDNIIAKFEIPNSNYLYPCGCLSWHIFYPSQVYLSEGTNTCHLSFSSFDFVFPDCELTAIQLSEISVNIPESVLKRSRLIVRNLSFKVSECTPIIQRQPMQMI